MRFALEMVMEIGVSMKTRILSHGNGNGNKTPTWEWERKGVGINVDGNGNDPYFHRGKLPRIFLTVVDLH